MSEQQLMKTRFNNIFNFDYLEVISFSMIERAELGTFHIFVLVYIFSDQSSLQPLTGYDYHAGYRMKIPLQIYKRSKSMLDLDIRNTRIPYRSGKNKENL